MAVGFAAAVKDVGMGIDIKFWVKPGAGALFPKVAQVMQQRVLAAGGWHLLQVPSCIKVFAGVKLSALPLG